MSSFSSSRCIRPIYLQESESDAGKCGMSNGLVYATVMCLIIGFFSFRQYLLDKSKNKPVNKTLIKLSIFFCIIFLGIVPIILYYHSRNSWRGYMDMKKELQAQNFTNMEILNILKGFNTDIPFISSMPMVSGVFKKENVTYRTNEKKEEEEKKEEVK